MTRAVIALGANLGDRAGSIFEALERIAEISDTQVVTVSSLVESAAVKPEGVDESAPEYLNAVAIVETGLAPSHLLMELNSIEEDAGRVRTERWGDRTLDLDIIAFDGVTMATEHLTIPHPRAHERSFVLVPWLEIEPEARIGGFGPIADLVPELAHEVRRYSLISPAVNG